MNNADKPAYPAIERGKDFYESAHLGLTKREYFAAKAMQGMLAGAWMLDAVDDEEPPRTSPESMVGASLKLADALIEELEK